MELSDLLDKPASAMTTEELIEATNLLRKLTTTNMETVSTKTTKTSKPTIKSNADKRIEDLLGKLTPEQLDQIKAKLGGLV